MRGLMKNNKRKSRFFEKQALGVRIVAAEWLADKGKPDHPDFWNADDVKAALEAHKEQYEHEYGYHEPDTNAWVWNCRDDAEIHETYLDAMDRAIEIAAKTHPTHADTGEALSGTRESVIQAIKDEMGYYDIPDSEPAITFTGKAVCDLVSLSEILMKENDQLDDAAHKKTLEIIELKKSLAALIPKAVDIKDVINVNHNGDRFIDSVDICKTKQFKGSFARDRAALQQPKACLKCNDTGEIFDEGRFEIGKD